MEKVILEVEAIIGNASASLKDGASELNHRGYALKV
jgi:hypothetical protein